MSQPVIYTAIFGDIDRLQDPPSPSVECDYVCFSDRPRESGVWDVRIVDSPFQDPRRAARQFKLLPHLYFSDCFLSMWVDGNLTPLRPLGAYADLAGPEAQLVTCAHPERRCLYREADVCRKSGRDAAVVIDGQIAQYRREGFPRDAGLAETNVLLRRHTEDVRRLSERWWAQLCRHSVRDQLSFNYVCWRERFRYGTFDRPARDSPLFRYTRH